MDERDARRVAEKLWEALQAGDWETARGCLHDDFVQEWPQSGERIVGRDNAMAIEQNFPGGCPRCGSVAPWPAATLPCSRSS
jgi:hypothetical protein